MEKDYVLDHDWGSYESVDRINKLLLRNEEDLKKYLYQVLTTIYNAKVEEDFTITFENGTKVKLILEIFHSP